MYDPRKEQHGMCLGAIPSSKAREMQHFCHSRTCLCHKVSENRIHIQGSTLGRSFAVTVCSVQCAFVKLPA